MISSEQVYSLTGQTIDRFRTVLIGSGWGAIGQTISAQVEGQPSVRAKLLTSASPGRDNLACLQSASGEWVAIANESVPTRETVTQNVRRSPTPTPQDALLLGSAIEVPRRNRTEIYFHEIALSSGRAARPVRVVSIPYALGDCRSSLDPNSPGDADIGAVIWYSSPNGSALPWSTNPTWFCNVFRLDHLFASFLNGNRYVRFPFPFAAGQEGELGYDVPGQGTLSGFYLRLGAIYDRSGNYVQSLVMQSQVNPNANAPMWQAMNYRYDRWRYAGGIWNAPGGEFSVAAALYSLSEFPDDPPAPPSAFYTDFVMGGGTSGVAGELVPTWGWSKLADSRSSVCDAVAPIPRPGQPAGGRRYNDYRVFVAGERQNRFVAVHHTPDCNTNALQVKRYFQIRGQRSIAIAQPADQDWRRAWFLGQAQHPCLNQAATGSHATAIEGRSVVAIEAQSLIDRRTTAGQIILSEQQINLDNTATCELRTPAQTRRKRIGAWDVESKYTLKASGVVRS